MITILNVTRQFIHYLVKNPGFQITTYFTMIYDRNAISQREVLSTDLINISVQSHLL